MIMGNNILIVDDAAFMRMMVKDILTKGGYNVVGEASSTIKILLPMIILPYIYSIYFILC